MLARFTMRHFAHPGVAFHSPRSRQRRRDREFAESKSGGEYSFQMAFDPTGGSSLVLAGELVDIHRLYEHAIVIAVTNEALAAVRRCFDRRPDRGCIGL
jgi:hypothetical protein